MAAFPWAEEEHEKCSWIQQVIAFGLIGVEY
jgi:hypothetical protein